MRATTSLKYTLFFLFVVLVLSCDGYRSASTKPFTSKSGYSNGTKNINGKQEKDPINPSQGKERIRLSAWGIITVVVTVIVSGMGYYYFTMCYPLICKKQRNYDIIELATV